MTFVGKSLLNWQDTYLEFDPRHEVSDRDVVILIIFMFGIMLLFAVFCIFGKSNLFFLIIGFGIIITMMAMFIISMVRV